MTTENRQAHDTLSIRKLHPLLGAEVRGVDFARPLATSTIQALKEAWSEHLVLVIPEQSISDRQHVDVTRYFGEPDDAIEDMDDAEATDLIAQLAEFAGQEQFVFRHEWATNDIVMWDNRCTMHYVTPHDPGERRVMHRTTIAGEEAVIAA